MNGFILGKWARSGIMLGLTVWVTGPNKKKWIYFLGQVRQKVGVYKTGSVFYIFIKRNDIFTTFLQKILSGKLLLIVIVEAKK